MGGKSAWAGKVHGREKCVGGKVRRQEKGSVGAGKVSGRKPEVWGGNRK